MEENATIIRCMHCGANGPAARYPVLNVDTQPELKARVLSNELFLMKCPKCEKLTPYAYDCTYVDAKANLVIVLRPGLKNSQFVERLNQLQQVFGSGGGRLHRVVSSPNELRELVLIHSAGLDDRAVFMCKMLMAGSLQQARVPITALYFASADLERQVLSFEFHLPNGQRMAKAMELKAYENCLEVVNQDHSLVRDAYLKLDLSWALQYMNQTAGLARELAAKRAAENNAKNESASSEQQE